MVKQICIHHNAISEDGKTWTYPRHSVSEQVRFEKKPVNITSCPKCLARAERLREFLRYKETDYGKKGKKEE